MKNLKLILKSLISNNACIEGGRKKPWYFAVIMLILSMVFAILPLFVQTINTNGDDVFKTATYGADEATLAYSRYLDENKITISVKDVGEEKKEFVALKSDGNPVDSEHQADFTHKTSFQKGPGYEPELVTDFYFYWRNQLDTGELNELVGDGLTSFMYLCPTQLFVHIVNFNTQTTIKDINCIEAANSFETGYTLNSVLIKTGTATEILNNTFNGWKLFIRTSYNKTRLTTLWQTCLIMGGINLGITLFMGLMIWILTRGKNNPYRLFNLWDTQKMAWWAAITPSLLTLALGFLIARFANILFPMLIGIRIMWLSMKSLRPDGSGYAAE